jgi:GT2 family glycosyltransferase
MSAGSYSETGLRFRYMLAQAAGMVRPRRRTGSSAPVPLRERAPGISVVIPSRNGRELLVEHLPGVVRELRDFTGEIVVVDNGSDDGTAEWLSFTYPQIVVEVSASPLSFAAAVNRGIQLARYSHVCLLNNDMLLHEGFFQHLGEAFDRVPDLFCATAQIFFPQGARREETGKAVMAQNGPEDFPIRCDPPVGFENLSYVLYGSGGCSVYDAAKLEALGNLDEVYQPAYVEDLDIGYRAWQRGWPTVFVQWSMVTHRHRATTSRYYTSEELDTVLEVNYLKFLARAVASPKVFRRLWKQAIDRLLMGAPDSLPKRTALAAAANIALAGGAAAESAMDEESILALTDGKVTVIPGKGSKGNPRVLVVASAIRMRKPRAIPNRDEVLVAFGFPIDMPSLELLKGCAEIVVVHRRRDPAQAALAFRAALRQMVRKWQPVESLIESPDLEPYAADCAPSRVTIEG